MKHPAPSDNLGKATRRWRIHAFDTQCRSLEEACDIIAKHQRIAKASASLKSNPRSLRMQFAAVKNKARFDKGFGKINLANGETSKIDPRIDRRRPPRPHPLRDKTRTEKKAMVQRMYVEGHWGIGNKARRDLAHAFGVTFFDVHVWLKEVETC